MSAEPAAAEPARPEPKLLSSRISGMFFLQWATWGIWLPVLGRIFDKQLSFSELEIGLLMGVPATLGAVAAPFVAGQLADRCFSAERLMGALVLITGGLLWIMAAQTTFAAWLILLTIGSVVRAPTVPLANALAFAHLPDPKAQYPKTRVWGTIGWIVAGWGFSMVWLTVNLHFQWLPPFFAGDKVGGGKVAILSARLVDSIRAGAVLSIIYGLYCFTLPHTPPKRKGVDPLAFRKAFKLFRFPSFAVLMAGGLFIACIHNIYFIQASKFLPELGLDDAYILPAMSTGQFAEIIVMVFLGAMLKSLGFRWVLLIGASAYVLRFAIFAATSLPLGVIVASQALHGVCFGCFIATAFIYVEHLAEEDIRASAQTLIGLVLGIAPVLGGLISAQLAALCAGPGVKLTKATYSPFWLSVTAIGLLATVFLAIFFRDETIEAHPANGPADELPQAPSRRA